jgi:predicted dehydrogenase
MAMDVTRRELLRNASLAAGLTALGGVWSEGEARASRSPNEKLNLAHIGAGGQGAADLNQTSSHPQVNIVALCDVDDARASYSFEKFPAAKKFKDYRKMLEEIGKEIDAVVVSIPDHNHAPAAVAAMTLGKHVYCQKPLAHSVEETRKMLETSRKHKVVTQMGTQAHRTYFPAVELIKSGIIGVVSEVHTVTDRPSGWWPQGIAKPTTAEPVPATLDWDHWLGVAQDRPYNSAYLPFVWRGWWDFGTGAMGDMGCHLISGPFQALDLRDPISIEAECDPRLPDSGPNWSIITWQFAKRGKREPVKLIWYDGGKKIPAEIIEDFKTDNGSVFVGDKGKVMVDHGNVTALYPKVKYRDVKIGDMKVGAVPGVPYDRGHYYQWIDACRTGGPTDTTFEFACPLTETVLLGNVAIRAGRKIDWDARKMRATNCPEADAYIRYHYRGGHRL